MNQNRVVIITGGASGIGLAITRRFALNGHPVAMLDLQQELLDVESRKLRDEGAKILARKVDVTKRDEIEQAYEAVRSELGPVSIMVANAGIASPQPFATMTPEQ